MKNLIFIARIFSVVFRPSYYPTVGTLILLSFTFLNQFPWVFRLWLLSLVYIFTFCLPALSVYLYRRAHGWSAQELRKRHKRAIPYIIYICSYLCLMHILSVTHMPHFLMAIVGINKLIRSFLPHKQKRYFRCRTKVCQSKLRCIYGNILKLCVQL